MTFPTIPTAAASRILVSTTAAGSSTHTFPNLTSLTKNSGDLLVAICITTYAVNANAEFSSWGASFVERGDFATNSLVSIGVASKWSTGSETGTFTVTTVGSTGHSQQILMSIPGAHATTPPEAGGYTTVVDCDPGSLTPSWGADDTLWIAVAGCGETATAGSFTGITAAPTSYTDYFDTGISGDVIGGLEGAVAFRQLNATSEDPGAFTNDTSSTQGGAITIAIRPVPTVGTNVNAALASATGAANNPTVTGDTNAAAALAAATGDAFNPTVSAGGPPVDVNAALATATGVANNPTVQAVPTQQVDRSIIANSDDAKEIPTEAPDIGQAVALLVDVDAHMGLRFTDLPIQNGATIVSATASLTITDSSKNDAEGTWYAHDVDDAQTFTTTNADLDGRTKTTASAAWTTNDLGVSGDRITSPNLAALVQEIVDRPGWQPGNNIALLYVHNSATDKFEVAMLEHATALAPSFRVDYLAIPIVYGVAQGHWTFTGTAIGQVGAGGVNAALAVATGAANNPAVAVASNPAAELASASGDAFNPTISTAAASEAQAGDALATGDAFNPTLTIASNPAAGLATATGAGFNATISTAAASEAQADDALATGDAFNPTVQGVSVAVAGTATATGTANNPTIQAAGVSDVLADDALASGAAFNPTLSIASNPAANLAAATGEAFNPTVQTEIVIPPTIPLAVQDPSHAVEVSDPLHAVLAADLPTALAITTNGQHAAAVTDAVKAVTVQDNDHNLMVSTPD